MTSSPTPERAPGDAVEQSGQQVRQPDVGPLARRYDELRDTGELWLELVELLVQEGELRGRRVLDVGCGTGRLATLLAEKYACKVWGVDSTPDMVEVASRRVPKGVRVKVAAAEKLPFRDAWFERVTTTLVIHLVDRPRAFAEIRRVLMEHGRYVLLTFDPSYFPGYYLNRFFPSFLEIDLARFPPADVLEQELGSAGFRSVRVANHRQRRSLDREAVLARIRGRHISTFQLISDDEYQDGLARAKRELPEDVTYDEHWLVVVAER